MDIKVIKEDVAVPFGKLKAGMVFKCYDNYYIKVDISLNLPTGKYYKIGGINLETGTFNGFLDNDKVNHKKAIVQITE